MCKKLFSIVLLLALAVSFAAADEGFGLKKAAKNDLSPPAAAGRGIGDIVRSIPAPGGGDPRGLTFDGTSLYMAENSTKMIYKIDPATGAVISSFSTPGQSYSEGVAWDGTYIWHAEYNGNVYKIDPSSGTVLATIMAPTYYPTGLTFDGVNLWCASYRDLAIYQFTTSGTLLKSFPSPGGNPWGMAWDGAYLWNCEYGGGMINQIDPSTGAVVASFPSPTGSWLLGLTFDGAYLWAVDHNTNMIYQIDIGLGPPSVDIKANGSDTGVQVKWPGNVKIDIAVQAGSGAGMPVDVWVVTLSSAGPFLYDGAGPYAGWWLDPAFKHPYFTGPLADMNATVLNRTIPIGNYRAIMGIDNVANGSLDLGAAVVAKDSVTIDVVP